MMDDLITWLRAQIDDDESTADHGPCFVIRCLALPYANRPGYREEWRP